MTILDADMNLVYHLTTTNAATPEALNLVGRFSVNCGLTASPNIEKPQIATPVYRKNAVEKLIFFFWRGSKQQSNENSRLNS